MKQKKFNLTLLSLMEVRGDGCPSSGTTRVSTGETVSLKWDHAG